MHKHNNGAPWSRWRALCLAAAAVGGSGVAAAQDAPPASAATPPDAPAASPAAHAANGADATERRFDVQEYIVRGNTVLDIRAIEAAVMPFLGADRSQRDLEAARDALLAVYQARGFQSVYVDLPEQSGQDGLIFLLVSETRVGRLRVSGAEYSSPIALRDQVSALREGQVPDFNRAQAELATLNQSGRQVVPLVKPGALPGTMDVDLKVEDRKPWRLNASLNNDRSADTRPLRLSLAFSHDNLWQKGHSLSLSFFGAPQDVGQSKVWSASYAAPVAGTPWGWELSGYLSDSNVATTGGTTVLGKGHAVGLKTTYTVPGGSDWWQTLSLGLDLKDNEEQLRMGTTGDRVPLKYAPFTAAYAGFVQGPSSQASVNLQLVAGTRSLFGYGSGGAAFDYKRYKGSPSFLVLKGDTTLSVDLGWLANAQLAVRASAQISDSALISSEQIAAGGQNSVRGYLSAESTGDYGAVMSVELRTPALSRGWLESARGYLFADAAHLRLHDPLPEQQSRFTLGSVGVGGSFRIGTSASGRLDLGVPLRQGQRTERHDRRLNFSLTATY
jgi:hemolysin activation/secretion protein